ncbi:biotin-dependent carboxyltransferase, partial [Fulvivirga sp. RKSG066]|uniref:5-oxoprolinase subunit C family protein n=1 Tax=Fulvivirga aurantia TaxID=2529383 RepID=UPI0012BD215C
MNKAKLHFKKPGLQTLIQDAGRYGFEAYGVPISGPMDKSAARIANALVQNPSDSPVIEITLLGPEIEVEGNLTVALTGADLAPTINGEKWPMHRTLDLKNGDILKFSHAQSGCRAYLAVAGDWMVTKWLGSASAATHQAEILTSESVIAKGSTIEFRTKEIKYKETNERPVLANVIRVRVLPGPEFDLFSKLNIAHFFGQGHKLHHDSNRMGCRLNTRLDFSPSEELISSGVIPGTIQVTNQGQPIILLADAQTTGGY